MLFDPGSHEPLVKTPWSESRARAAIAAIVVDAENAFDEEALWPAHPLDDEVTSAETLTLYLGASGVIWALDELERPARPSYGAAGREQPPPCTGATSVRTSATRRRPSSWVNPGSCSSPTVSRLRPGKKNGYWLAFGATSRTRSGS